MSLKEMSLKEIGTRCNTDKVTHHHYERFYEQYLREYKNKLHGAILEIGVDRGSSMKMWKEYFPNLFIYGVDIGVSDVGERYEIFKTDQSSHEQLNILIEKLVQRDRPVHVINDDGSHIPEHQILTFNLLFDKILEPGGIYIIEDIETSYWTKGGLYNYETRYGYLHPQSIVEKFKDVIDYINREFVLNNVSMYEKLRNSQFDVNTLKHISFVTFAHNCIIIRKKLPEEYELDDRQYRFLEYL